MQTYYQLIVLNVKNNYTTFYYFVGQKYYVKCQTYKLLTHYNIMIIINSPTLVICIPVFL